jgi:hypothetical protein
MNELLLSGLQSNNNKLSDACRKRILAQKFIDSTYAKILQKIDDIPIENTKEIVDEIVTEVVDTVGENIVDVKDNDEIELATNVIADGFQNVVDNSVTTSIDSPSRANLEKRRSVININPSTK